MQVSGWTCEVKTGFAKVELKLQENMKLPSSYANNEFSTSAADLGYAWDRAPPPLGPPVPCSRLQMQRPALRVRGGQQGSHC